VRAVAIGWSLLLVAGCRSASDPPRAGPAGPAFASKPAVTRDGGAVRIAFAATGETDVAVFVEDAKGHVLRHLAAGVLGRNPPAPLVAGSLKQSLVWDGKDDLGRPAEGGPFRVRVGLGLRPAFESLIGFRPEALGGVRGLATGPGGELYVFHCYGSAHPHDGTTVCTVLGRDGKYLKTILPYPANLPEAKLKGLKRVDLGNGIKVPFIYQFETRSMIPGLGDLPSQRPVVTRDGRLAFVGVQEGPQPFAQAGEARLTVVHTDGSVPEGGVLRAPIAPLTDSAASLALSPDEKTIYATGVRACTHQAVKPGSKGACGDCEHSGNTWEHTAPDRMVYRLGWGDAPAESFGRDLGLKEPVSVATDQAGKVYVADLADDRIAVFKPDGAPAGSIKVSRPQRVEVHRKTGAVYVLSGDKGLALVKLTADGREVARAELPLGGKGGFFPIRRPVMALDDSAEPAVLWVGGPLLRVEDRGESFGEPVRAVPDAADGGPGSIGPVMDLSLDRERGLLYVSHGWRYHTAAGTWEKLTAPGIPMWPGSSPSSANGTVGLDGNYYVCVGNYYATPESIRDRSSTMANPPGSKGCYLCRQGPDLKLRPFPASGEQEGRLRAPAMDFGCGQTADARGNVYVIWKKAPADPGDGARAHALYLYGPDGQLKKAKLVDAEFAHIRSVRVDRAGNIYLAVGLRPGRDQLPPGLAGALPEGPEDRDAVNGVNGYPLLYGSIVKFGPAGGVIRKGSGGLPCNYGYGVATEVKGAQWLFPGASTVASWKAPGNIMACYCELPGLDVDGFGRSFFCDAGRFRVGVIDTAGNRICWFGGYGNQDSAGPASAIPAPELAFCWPQAVAVDDAAAYVGDRLNRRIVRVKLGYAVEQSLAVP